MGGARTDLVYPRGIPDLFRGSQVTLIGRYSGDANLESVRLTLTGQSGGSTRTYHYDSLSFPSRNENNDYLPRLWATGRVGWLMEQVRTNGEQKELRDEIVDLGTRYGIVTPYTSYLALEEGQVSRRDMNFVITPGEAAARPSKGGFGRMNAPNSAPGPTPMTQAVTGAD